MIKMGKSIRHKWIKTHSNPILGFTGAMRCSSYVSSKALIVGTRWNRINVAVSTSTRTAHVGAIFNIAKHHDFSSEKCQFLYNCSCVLI